MSDGVYCKGLDALYPKAQFALASRIAAVIPSSIAETPPPRAHVWLVKTATEDHRCVKELYKLSVYGTLANDCPHGLRCSVCSSPEAYLAAVHPRRYAATISILPASRYGSLYPGAIIMPWHVSSSKRTGSTLSPRPFATTLSVPLVLRSTPLASNGEVSNLLDLDLRWHIVRCVSSRRACYRCVCPVIVID